MTKYMNHYYKNMNSYCNRFNSSCMLKYAASSCPHSEFALKQIDCSEILLLYVLERCKRNYLVKKCNNSIKNFCQYFNLKIGVIGQIDI